jgi:hypothetical protein
MDGGFIGINAVFALNYALAGYGVLAWSWAAIRGAEGCAAPVGGVLLVYAGGFMPY